MRRLFIAVALLALACPAGSTAAAQSGILGPALDLGTPTSSTSVPVALHGELTVFFHGDAASGCAQRRLCGYRGTVSWRPGRAGELGIVNYRRAAPMAYLGLDSGASSNSVGAVTTAKVLAPERCSDAVGAPVELELPRRGHAIALDLLGAAPGLLSTRCAGPLAADVSSSLPVPRLPIAGLTHPPKTIDLTAERAFAAHGLAGTVSSTIVLHLGRGRQASGFASPPGDQRYVEVLYRATISGALTADLSGHANPLLCAPLGSCGEAGTVRVQPRASGTGDLVVGAHDSRQSYADLLSTLGLAHSRHPGAVDALGEITWRSGGSVQADLATGSGGCRDSARLTPGSILLAGQHRTLTVIYPNAPLPALGGMAGPSVLRTRCPGPLGSAQPLAGTRLPLRRLGAREATLTLGTGRAFTEAGWSIRTEPHLTLTLKRVRIVRGLLPQASG